MPQKFTFKTEKPTGQWRAFQPTFHYIKLNKKEVGSIDDKEPHSIRLTVIKADINEDGNPNCEWKWIKLKGKFSSVQDAKDYLNNNIDSILQTYNLYYLEFLKKHFVNQFPVYIEYGHAVHKIESTDKYIDIEDSPHDTGIKIVRGKDVSNFILKNGARVSEAAFNNAQQVALSKLTRELFMQASTSATDEDIRAKIWDELPHEQTINI